MKQYLFDFPHLRQMVIILKYILNCRGLNEVWTGGLGSYALTLLVVNFFQQHPRKTAKESGESLGVLLLEFFELYGRNFNYEQNGIQVRNEGKNAYDWSANDNRFSVGYVPIEELRKQMNTGSRKFGPLCIEGKVSNSKDRVFRLKFRSSQRDK